MFLGQASIDHPLGLRYNDSAIIGSSPPRGALLTEKAFPVRTRRVLAFFDIERKGIAERNDLGFSDDRGKDLSPRRFII